MVEGWKCCGCSWPLVVDYSEVGEDGLEMAGLAEKIGDSTVAAVSQGEGCRTAAARTMLRIWGRRSAAQRRAEQSAATRQQLSLALLLAVSSCPSLSATVARASTPSHPYP
jgi:hypothetical protein